MRLDFSLSAFQKPFILTGAGISAESGLATFRGADGLWEGHRIEDVATPEAFDRDPKLVWKFYSMRREAAFRAKPNAAHEALARFVLERPQTKLVTQNVDGLHERAHRAVGAPPPLAMHGQLEVTRCERCGKAWSDRRRYFDEEGQPVSETDFGPAEGTDLEPLPSPDRDRNGLPLSSCCSGRLRPDIVWFGETPYFLETILEAIESCDAFLAVGTSGQVYPAAGFLSVVRRRGAPTAIIGAEKPANGNPKDVFFEGNATHWVPRVAGVAP